MCFWSLKTLETIFKKTLKILTNGINWKNPWNIFETQVARNDFKLDFESGNRKYLIPRKGGVWIKSYKSKEGGGVMGITLEWNEGQTSMDS